MQKRFDYTSLGFYTFDVLARPADSLPAGGETFFVDDMTLAVSGAAGSAAIVAAKYQFEVQAVGGVGNDLMGPWVLQRLQEYGVDILSMEVVEGRSTSSSMVAASDTGERSVLHRRGATANFLVRDDQIDRVTDTKILHIGGVGLMSAMDQGRTLEVMKAAKQRGCITTLDVFASSREDFSLIEPLLPYTDYFLPSKEEAIALTGSQNVDEVCDILLKKGAKAVVLTLGAGGAMYRDKRGHGFKSTAFDVDVVCSCGCGDCFNAGFATGLLLGLEPESCVDMAQATSAQNAMGLGSQAVVSSLEETVKFMKVVEKKAEDEMGKDQDLLHGS